MASQRYTNSFRGQSVAFDSSSSSQVSIKWSWLWSWSVLSSPGVKRPNDVTISQHPEMVISHRVHLVWYLQVRYDNSEAFFPIIDQSEACWPIRCLHSNYWAIRCVHFNCDQSGVRGEFRCWEAWPPTCRPTPRPSSRARRDSGSALSPLRPRCSTRSRCQGAWEGGRIWIFYVWCGKWHKHFSPPVFKHTWLMKFRI